MLIKIGSHYIGFTELKKKIEGFNVLLFYVFVMDVLKTYQLI